MRRCGWWVLVCLLTACGRPAGYPLTTCVVCDRALDRFGSSVTFSVEGFEMKACMEEHRREAEKNPEAYLKKIREVKVL
ncbi:MAG: hypothetical protein SFU53_05140 [Terrimicrobiaceae bacterium]|nr:hypothetical protein [Terrimicrobiaceae bacterium]